MIYYSAHNSVPLDSEPEPDESSPHTFIYI